MTISEIKRVITTAQVIGDAPDDLDILHLLTDSRELGADAEHTLFFALRTERNDGARYIDELRAKGVRAFVVGDDVLTALQDLAAYKRSLYHGPVIGITGSNGKTVVKEWLYQLLKDDYTVVRSPKSYNSQIGVPLSIWQLRDDTTLAIFEAGISRPGEMERLERVIRPTLGVITYIGPEHGENFASADEKRREKMKLFASCPVIEDPTHQNVRTCAAVLRALGYDEETITARILAQTHETMMEVNLSALVDNVRYFRSLLRPTTRLTCMVKAFAYGSGSVEVSLALQRSGLVDYLAVAVADEGVELRRAGVTLPIIVMDPEVAAMDMILENNLEPNVYSFAAFDAVYTAAVAKGIESYPIHIKVDSGMHRLGFYREDMPLLKTKVAEQTCLRIASVFSHLAGADEPQFDAFTREQIAYFDTCAKELNAPGALLHICNSAGIERFADAQYDMCRLGIGMYGFSFAGAKLRNVCALKTTLLSVKTVPAGETIGYGRHTTLQEDRVIGVIPIGYADGFDRRFSNYGGEVYVRGKRCPIVGNVCMDQAMVDLTGTDAQVGDGVEVFGDHLPIEEIAEKLGTITYEVLTSVSRRVKRVYMYGNG